MLKKIIYIITLLFFSVTNSYANENAFALKQDKNLIYFEINLTKDQTIYWIYPGKIGAPTDIDLSKSENIKDAKILWPFPSQGIKENTNEKAYYYKHLVQIPLYFEVLNKNHPALIHADITYILCSDQCQLIRQHLSESINLDRDLAEPSNFEIKNIKHKNDHLSFIAIFQEEVQIPEFLFNNKINEQIADITVIKQDDQSYFVSIDFLKDSHIEPGSYEIYSSKADLPALLRLDIPKEGAEAGLLKIMIFALLGGFILNFMPCVLPVFALKILSFVKYPNSDRKIACLLTILGIITSFWGLALIAILLKNSGKYFGLGINFQNPTFIIILILIITIFISSSLNRIHLSLPTRLTNSLAGMRFKNHHFDHFFSGILATILSTPCNAPFLGTSMSLSLASSNLLIFSTFTLIAIGFTIPYILLALRPGLLKFVPKSASQVKWIKYILSALLALTLIWLLTILASQMDLRAAALVAGLALLLKFTIESKKGPRIILTLIIFALALTLPQKAYVEDEAHEQIIDHLWQAFEPDKIDEYVKNGKIVFVDITADWCITCKYNKIMTLDRASTIKLLLSPNIIAMRGDLTNHNPLIHQYMLKNQLHGIPINKIYGPSAPEGKELPVLVHYQDIKDAIEKLTNQR